MNKYYLNQYIFFIILDGKLICWDYKNHQQFKIEEKYFLRLLEISQESVNESLLDKELETNHLISNTQDEEIWGWDCLSKIFHFGTSINKEDLAEVEMDDPNIFTQNYISLCNEKQVTSPPLLIEKQGKVTFLPKPDLSVYEEIDFLTILNKRKTCREFIQESISLEKISSLLHVVFGNFHLGDKQNGGLESKRIGSRKTSPSAGGLNACEAYLVVLNISNLEKGIYHYQAANHSLTLINEIDISNQLTQIFCGQFFLKNISMGIFITSRFEKLWHKYPHSRAYRAALLDVGHLSQTFQLAASALDLNPWLSAAFDDSEVSKLLKLGQVNEQPLFFVGAGVGNWSSFDSVTKKIFSELENVS